MTHETTDVRGLSLTGASAAASQRFDALLDDLYYYRPGTPERLEALLDEFPTFVLAHVLKGYSHMSEAMLDAEPRASEQLSIVETLAANARERLHIEALRAWIARDFIGRAAAWAQILETWPLDLLAFRQYTGALFWSGDKRHQARITTDVLTHWEPRTPGYAHALSAHAFAMEEVGEYAMAERLAREALDVEPQDLWALHGLAHVLEMQGRFREGAELLGGATPFLNDYNLFRGHLWWHLALFELSQSRFDEVLELFDREIYPRPSAFYLDVQNGASLLARLECQGIDVGTARWERLAEASAHSATQCTLWFTAMHHVMALARCGRDAAVEQTLDYLRTVGEDMEQAAVAHELGGAAAALYGGRPDEALAGMLAVRSRQGQLGASHAQQDLYDQMMVAAALALDDWSRVRELLDARLAMRAESRQRYSANEVRDIPAVQAALRWQAR